MNRCTFCAGDHAVAECPNIDPEQAFDERVRERVVSQIANNRHPGIQTPMDYTTRSQVERSFPQGERQAVAGAISRLLRAGAFRHYYGPDGMRLFV